MASTGNPLSSPPSSASSSSSLDNRLQLAGAQSQMDFELEFFAGVLERHPDYVDVLKVHAKNLAQRGRHAEGLIVDRRIARLRPVDALAHYNLACSYALTDQADDALSSLRKAVELGYRDAKFMREDRDLESVRKDPRFREIIRFAETGS